MSESEDSVLAQHGYFIRHHAQESGPYQMVQLRVMWAEGSIDKSTKFKRSDWTYWADAADLEMELEFVPPKPEPEPPPIPLHLAAPKSQKQQASQVHPAKQKTIVKTYHGREREATSAFVKDSEVMAKQGYYPTSQNFNPGSYGTGSFIVAALLCFVCIGIIVFVYMLLVKPPGVLTVTYELREENQIAPQSPTSTAPPMPRYFIIQGGGVTGPHETAFLRALRGAGQISNETLCCLEGSETWKELGSVLS